jgi:hypothetical protein
MYIQNSFHFEGQGQCSCVMTQRPECIAKCAMKVVFNGALRNTTYRFVNHVGVLMLSNISRVDVPSRSRNVDPIEQIISWEAKSLSSARNLLYFMAFERLKIVCGRVQNRTLLWARWKQVCMHFLLSVYATRTARLFLLDLTKRKVQPFLTSTFLIGWKSRT